MIRRERKVEVKTSLPYPCFYEGAVPQLPGDAPSPSVLLVRAQDWIWGPGSGGGAAGTAVTAERRSGMKWRTL